MLNSTVDQDPARKEPVLDIVVIILTSLILGLMILTTIIGTARTFSGGDESVNKIVNDFQATTDFDS